MYKISVIIPTLQKNIKILNKLLKVIHQDEAVAEIILIDNSCKGFETNLPKVRVIVPKANLFVNPSWNLGVKEAKEDYYALVNDDLLVCENFFSNCLKLIENVKSFGCLGMAKESVINTQIKKYPKPKKIRLKEEKEINERPENWGTIIIGKKEIYREIPRKIKIWCGDDYIRWSAVKQGYKVFKLENAEIFHLGSLSSNNPTLFQLELKDIFTYGKVNKEFKKSSVYKGAINAVTEKFFSLKLFNLFPLFEQYIRSGRKVWKLFGIPLLKIRHIAYDNAVKYYVLNVLVAKVVKIVNPKKDYISKAENDTMKLGVSYNLFDGEELLEASIKSIRKEADFISVIYQKESYRGQPASPTVESLLHKLKRKGLIDEIYLYERNFNQHKDKHIYECEKRDIGLKLAKDNGCTHYLSMDVDEFYDAEQLHEAKSFILRHNIETSAVSIIEYLKKPIYKILNGYTYTGNYKGMYNFYCPFIMKINAGEQRHSNNHYPCLVDPTRALNNDGNFYLFSVQNIVMHHMSTVRKNLEIKYNNSNLLAENNKNQKKIKKLQQNILNWNFNDMKINDKYAVFDGKIVEKVENQFNVKC